MNEPEILWLAVLVGAAFLAGLVDSIAGGGGLITVPALLVAGLSPIETLATNKSQAVFGSSTAALSYARAGLVDARRSLPWALASGAAAAGGAVVADALPDDTLDVAIPVALVAIAVFFAVRRDLDDADRAARWSRRALGLSVIPLIGFYDGVFGPGTGSFFMVALVTLGGMGVLRATGHTKLLNFASNAGALVVFAFGGSIVWAAGIPMGLAQVAGAATGSRLAIRRGVGLIRPLLVVVCAAVAVRQLL